MIKQRNRNSLFFTIFTIAFFIELFCLCSEAKAGNITSAKIIENTYSAVTKGKTCLNYKIPTQYCLWYTPPYEFNTTLVLDHYLPDLVVVIYRNAGENPWMEVNAIIDTPSAQVQKGLLTKAVAPFVKEVGSGNHSLISQTDHDAIFKEADVIGNPGLIGFDAMAGEFLLQSTAMPGVPYYQSMLDSLLWRGLMPEALPEEAASAVLGVKHRVGSGITDWGGVYPHGGSVSGIDDLKASMVITQRAADLLTNAIMTFGHLHQPLSTVCGRHCNAAPVQENSKETLFQAVYPKEQDDCAILGTDQAYNDNRLNDAGAYVWIVWRHYHGCSDGGEQFVGVFP